MGISLVNMQADIMIAASSYVMPYHYHAILYYACENRTPCLDMNQRQGFGNVIDYVNDLHFVAFLLQPLYKRSTPELGNTTFYKTTHLRQHQSSKHEHVVPFRQVEQNLSKDNIKNGCGKRAKTLETYPW